MRLEIIIPDSTSSDLKARLKVLTQLLSEKPELVRGFELDDDEDIQRMFTPERLAQIAKAKADIDAGNGLSLEQVDANLSASRAAWVAAHQP